MSILLITTTWLNLIWSLTINFCRQSSNSISRDKGRVNQTLGPQLHQMRNYNLAQDTDYSYSGRTSGGRLPSSSLFGSAEMKNEVASRNNSMEKSSAENSRNSSVKLESPSKEAMKGENQFLLCFLIKRWRWRRKKLTFRCNLAC